MGWLLASKITNYLFVTLKLLEVQKNSILVNLQMIYQGHQLHFIIFNQGQYTKRVLAQATYVCTLTLT